MYNVLVVDDSPSMRSMISLTLDQAGYKTQETNDGVEALAVAKSNRFDLIITDINMPEMDGIQLIKELRCVEQYKFTPILVLTTESGNNMKMKGKEAGATGWIVKPFDPGKLLSALARVLD